MNPVPSVSTVPDMHQRHKYSSWILTWSTLNWNFTWRFHNNVSLFYHSYEHTKHEKVRSSFISVHFSNLPQASIPLLSIPAVGCTLEVRRICFTLYTVTPAMTRTTKSMAMTPTSMNFSGSDSSFSLMFGMNLTDVCSTIWN